MRDPSHISTNHRPAPPPRHDCLPHPSGRELTVALACTKDGWPYPEWPAKHSLIRTQLVLPPYDQLRSGHRDSPDAVVLRCD
jgi:hypothetical protein